ncbi:DUF3048 domain-containing protein [Hoyosella sp. G463]|uniref:DUF3048 domain-containing protein n=1 Tax=Lolliginicoccus lacisalsi TaxID=2742202 RepID=A0A927J9I6_9ACTN|nr:DUF3048 domain-containing protein [Lolliginicoccus lacisalsi]MBD8505006.1 DUF3048 domain-containing protein [Lolliginicoccus lacisalsi]
MLRVARGAAAAVGLLGVLAMASCGQGPIDAPAPSSSAPPPTTVAPAPPAPVVVVKIDNVAAARPQSGVQDASLVIVEPVEGGLTRLMAVLEAPFPEVLGPVRSARITDLDLLRQFGEPTFAYSGAAREVLERFNEAPLINATESSAAGAFFRDPGRAAPHNLYVRAGDLPRPAVGPARPLVETGDLPGGGEPAAAEDVVYERAAYQLNWSDSGEAWSITLDGQPFSTLDGGEIAVENIAIARVPVRDGLLGSPEAGTTGSGEATILRDGQRFDGRWMRPSATDPFRFASATGQDLPLAEGTTWIFLVPDA